MIHHWMTVVFAANWGFAALMLAVGYGLGWCMSVRLLFETPAKIPKTEDLATFSELGQFKMPMTLHRDQPADTPIAPVTPQPVFKTQSGQAVESPRTWDQRLARFGGPEQIPYEELEGMFLDQFLLRYFYSLMPDAPFGTVFDVSLQPWDSFVVTHEWAKEMPLLFEQMTGYKLNDRQLNNAIAEWTRRLSKPTPAAPDARSWLSSPPDQKCRKCGAVGYSANEFLSPHTGLCSACSQSAVPNAQRAETSIQRQTTG